MFLVYINDMKDDLQSSLSLFADDNLMHISSKSDKTNKNILNLGIMKTWADQWLIKFRVIIQSNLWSSHIGAAKFRVIIQSNLWSSHIDYICKKSSKLLDILNSVSHKLSRKSLETMYFSYVRSILEYADILVCNTSQENLKQIDTIQKRAGKIVSGAIRCTSSNMIYEELSWQRLSDRRQNCMTILYSDIIHHRAPSFLFPHIPEIVENRVQSRYPLRNR